MSGRVLVVGLGPAGSELTLPIARAALGRVDAPFARTERHPAVDDLRAEGVAFRTFDSLYDSATRMDEVYEAIVDALVEAAETEGEVVYAVPGSPAVAERSVELLRQAAVELELVPGLSFVDLAWSRLGVDPSHGARVVDGHRFALDAPGVSGRLLVAQCDTLEVLSEVKLALLEVLPASSSVSVLQRLGLPDETVATVTLEDLDRQVDPDHLTSLYVDAGERAVGLEMASFVALMERLRGPGGCPWDAEQTHHSLARYVLEEAYEVVEALGALPRAAPGGDTDPAAYAALADELGDLLCQVVFHAMLAAEADAFTIDDVIQGIHDKLVRRHPHVFGEVEVDGPGDVVRNWEEIKRAERLSTSVVAGIEAGLPSLLYAHKLYRKAASVGFEVSDPARATVRVREVAAALAEADDPEPLLGELLGQVVALSRGHGLDAESALRGWSARFRERLERAETLAREQGREPGGLGPTTSADLWEEAGSSET